MRKVKILISLLLLCLVIPSALSFAAENPDVIAKKKVVFIVSNDKAVSNIYDKELKKIIIDPVVQKLSSRYGVFTDTKYYEKLKSMGYASIIEAERSDITDAFKDDNIDYVLLIETLPGTYTHGWYNTYTSSLHMRIVDMKLNKNIYNGKLSDERKTILAKKILVIIDEKLMQNQDAADSKK